MSCRDASYLQNTTNNSYSKLFHFMKIQNENSMALMFDFPRERCPEVVSAPQTRQIWSTCSTISPPRCPRTSTRTGHGQNHGRRLWRRVTNNYRQITRLLVPDSTRRPHQNLGVVSVWHHLRRQNLVADPRLPQNWQGM